MKTFKKSTHENVIPKENVQVNIALIKSTFLVKTYCIRIVNRILENCGVSRQNYRTRVVLDSVLTGYPANNFSRLRISGLAG